MKYRKISEIVEAFKYDGGLKGSDGKYYVPDWAVKALDDKNMCYVSMNDEPPELFLRTVSKYSGERLEKVNVGDYVTINESGSIITYDEKFFNTMFEPVE